MFNKIRVLAILSVVFTCVISCDDSLDEIFQESSKINTERLLESVEVYFGEKEQAYTFEYNDDFQLKKLTYKDNGSEEKESVELEYAEENGRLNNFEDVIKQIFYIDSIFKIPYEYDSFYIRAQENNSQGYPSLIKMNLDMEDGSSIYKYVKITYDQNPNIYKPYLMAGGIMEAAEQNVLNEGRSQLFESTFISPNNPSSIAFFDENNILEHMYFTDYEYDKKQRISSGTITYFDIIQSEKPEITTVIYSYLDSTIK